MHILKHSFFITPLREGHYLLDPTFLNRYNTYLLNSKYPSLSEDLPDTVEEILNRPFYIDDVSLYEFLDELYNVEDLKQICRDYRIKGFSNKRKDDINELIVETLMDPSGQLLDQLLQRDSDLKSLIASFIITDTNTLEPTNHELHRY